MDWAFKRQITFFLFFLLIILFLGFLLVRPYLNKAPTCFDLKQNGNESGIDCGGSCSLACSAETENIAVLWSRSFEIKPGKYNAVAYLQNYNENMAVQRIKYRFRFADKDNLYIGSKEGETFIPALSKFAIFEPGIDLGNSIPVYTTFEFIDNPIWIQLDNTKVNQLKILFSDIKFINKENENPKLSVSVENDSLFRIPEVSFIVILYDKLGNAISISKTYLDMLQPEEKTKVYFIWRNNFEKEIINKEIIPIYNIFSVKLE